ncbi:hypothetical protein COY95_04365 [Candidatus Woesearchaeota archaeon CG_4_10_14_0_8_um_filter_47_5]|nr:MAG: hypothetical protein COY95_04365 [Candidatus Woesearchaeota archaeon CG_4_10_14_0_8_um_filter_47_5]
MKYSIFILLSAALLTLTALSACTAPPDQQPITSFEECATAGNPVMESYPRQCRTQTGALFVEVVNAAAPQDAVHTCTPEESAAVACTMEYAPVCGKIVLNMGDTMYQTFGNGCSACSAMKVVSYTPGECPAPIGGERDEHGCLGPAGYSWNEEVGACIREWELNEDQRRAAQIAVMIQSYSPLTVTEVRPGQCTGCFVVSLQDENQNTRTVTLTDWKVSTEETPPGGALEGSLSEEQARTLAQESACTEEGRLSDEAFYNPNTQTWWITLILGTERQGCSPACVVSEHDQSAEINWRCTGLIP